MRERSSRKIRVTKKTHGFVLPTATLATLIVLKANLTFAFFGMTKSLQIEEGRCGVSPLEGVASNKVRARGRLSPSKIINYHYQL